jgi:hypothetical protein
MFEFVTVEFLQLAQRVVKDRIGNGWLDVGNLCLHAFVADRGKFTQFIGHAAQLAAHPEPADLAGVVTGQGFGGSGNTDALRRPQRIQHFFQAAANNRISRRMS